MADEIDFRALCSWTLAQLADAEDAANAALVEAVFPHFGDTAADALLGLAESEGADAVAIAHYRRYVPARVLADVEAKRGLIEWAQAIEYLRSVGDPAAPARPVGIEAVQIIAEAYADQDGYDEAWRI